MRYAIVLDGIVINAVEAEAQFAADQGWLSLPDGYGPGDLHDGNTFTHPAAVPLDPADFPLTMRQLRLGLKRFGGKPASFIQDTIDGIADQDAKDEAQIWYDETEIVHWDHAETQALMALSGIPTANAKAMWMAAKDIA